MGSDAQGNLSNPSLFLPPDHPHFHPSVFVLAHRYLDIVESLKTPTAASAIKSHMYRMLKKVLDQGEDETFRIKIAKAQIGQDQGVSALRKVLHELEESVKVGFSSSPFSTASYISARNRSSRPKFRTTSTRCKYWVSRTARLRLAAIYPSGPDLDKSHRR